MRFLPRLAPLFFLAAATVSSGAFAQSSAAPADQSYPSKMVRIINPFSAGGPTDILSRAVAEQLSARWGQTVIVEGKPGAGGNIAMEYVARAPADGYTLVTAPTGTLVINQHVFPNMRYDAFKDFTPITLMASIDNVLIVNKDVPAKNLKEFIAYAKANPGKLSYGSPGIGAQPHLAGEMFNRATGIDMLHIPFKGTSEAATALMGGQITALLGQVSAVAPMLQGGKVRAIGIASLKRNPALPDVPTLDEQGLTGFESASIYALMAPAGTPAPIVNKLAKEVRSILRTPETQKKITDMGMDVVANSPQELAELMRKESARYEKIVKEANIKAQ